MKKNDILSLAAQLGKFEGMSTQLPPVQDWNPELSGVMDMTIRSNGTWWHEGTEIHREKLVRLFSTILKREGDRYFLVTPIEKWEIEVEDVPFLAILSEVADSENGTRVISIITSVGDEVALNEQHPLILDGGDAPLVEIRNGLHARLNRNLYYEFASLAEERDGQYILESGGIKHVLSA